MKKIIKLLLFLFIFSLLFSTYKHSANAVDSSGIWQQVGSLSSPRTVPGIALLQSGKVLITGGYYNGDILKTSEIYDPISKVWSITGDLNLQRMLVGSYQLVNLSDGRVFVAGGEGPSFVQGLSAAETYDPSSGTWTQVSSANVGRYRSVIAPLPDNKVLFTAGKADSGITGVTEIYNPSDDTWTLTGDMNIGREGNPASVVLNDGRVMVAGGVSYFTSAEESAEVYDPDTGQWTISTMPYGMNTGTLTRLNNGKVLAVGAGSNVALYDPDTNTWSITSSLTTPRISHGAFLLSDGNVLVYGGSSNLGPVNTSEIYNPNTDSWTPGPPLPQALESPWPIRLQNGDYLIVGGGNITGPLATAYIFTSSSSDINLSVPLFKQTESPWGSQVYDFANIWSPLQPNISSWGCALTSAAMVFKYHGIDMLPDGTTLDPGTLNSWLKSQPDGYVRNGLVNWLALSRLSRLAKVINGLDFDALEYKRTHGYNPDGLTEAINQGTPGILGEPGHFIVGKGISADTFNINDPFFDRDSLEDYGNSFLSLGTYTPSTTDLSYIMLVVNEGVNISLTDSDSDATGSAFIQDPLDNDEGLGSSGDTLKIFYLPKPGEDTYNLNLSAGGDQSYNLDVYFYDMDGNVNILNLNGILGDLSQDNFEINFDSDNSDNSSINLIGSISDTYFDLEFLYLNGEIKNKGIYNSLLSKLKNAEKTHNIKTKINILNSLINELNAQRGKGVTEPAYQIILQNINSILSSL